MKTGSKHILWLWLPVVAWLGVIAIESTDWLSAEHTGEALYWLVVQIFGQVDRHSLQAVHHLLRKGGHFAGYGILCLLIFRALRGTLRGTLGLWTALSIAGTVLVASLDEWHQTFIPSRTGCVRDVVLDTIGAICLQAIALLLIHTRRQYQKARPQPG